MRCSHLISFTIWLLEEIVCAQGTARSSKDDTTGQNGDFRSHIISRAAIEHCRGKSAFQFYSLMYGLNSYEDGNCLVTIQSIRVLEFYISHICRFPKRRSKIYDWLSNSEGNIDYKHTYIAYISNWLRLSPKRTCDSDWQWTFLHEFHKPPVLHIKAI